MYGLFDDEVEPTKEVTDKIKFDTLKKYCKLDKNGNLVRKDGKEIHKRINISIGNFTIGESTATWALANNRMPQKDTHIHHINDKSTDNRASNLEEIPIKIHLNNRRNNIARTKIYKIKVYKHAPGYRVVQYVGHNVGHSHSTFLGYFKTKQEAEAFAATLDNTIKYPVSYKKLCDKNFGKR